MHRAQLQLVDDQNNAIRIYDIEVPCGVIPVVGGKMLYEYTDEELIQELQGRHRATEA